MSSVFYIYQSKQTEVFCYCNLYVKQSKLNIAKIMKISKAKNITHSISHKNN